MSTSLFAIAEAAARTRGVRDIEVIFERHNAALTRFANNAIHQNVAEIDHAISIRVSEDHRTARASTNRLHRDSIEAAVEHFRGGASSSVKHPSVFDQHRQACSRRNDNRQRSGRNISFLSRVYFSPE